MNKSALLIGVALVGVAYLLFAKKSNTIATGEVGYGYQGWNPLASSGNVAEWQAQWNKTFNGYAKDVFGTPSLDPTGGSGIPPVIYSPLQALGARS